ncbi:MAG: condensation domain-containing protein, partial [Gammaproteobacteria bacterium]
MNLSEALAELSDLGVKLWAEGEQLRIRAPVRRLTPELRNALAENKAEILVLLHQRNISASVTSVPLAPVPRNGHLSLSFAQERLWFLDQLEGPTATYNIPAGLKLNGVLNIGALKGGLEEVVSRHEVLRTTFPTVDGAAVQVIVSEPAVPLPVVNLEGLSKEGQTAELRRVVVEEVRRPFDLVRGPLLRACLLKLGEEVHGLLVTAHHIVADGWSREVFVQELSALYQAFSLGLPSPLAGLPLQYADYAEWQRRWLEGEVLEGQLRYWREQLAGAPALLELPTDHPRPPVQRFRGATAA